MKPAPKYIKIAGLVSLLILPAFFLFFFASGKHKFARLPIYGEKTPIAKAVNGKTDTMYHTVPAWSFINQHGKTISDKDYEGKVYVADFFFTSCGTICPKMTKQMARLQWRLKDHAYKDVMLLSHTVDPENDSPGQLLKYAEAHKADFSKWNFVTGEKSDLYEMGVNGYLVSAQEDVLAPGGFLHSEKFVLVDKKKRIRGFYDGTSIKEVDQLVDDIKLLMKEEKIEAEEAASH